MLDKSIQMIQEAEKQAEQEKVSCRAELQRMLSEAEADAARLCAQVGDTLRQEHQAQLAQAEASAAEIRTQIWEDARRQCNMLQAQAKQNQERALEYILTKGV